LRKGRFGERGGVLEKGRGEFGKGQGFWKKGDWLERGKGEVREPLQVLERKGKWREGKYKR
jgi:hypothetical protein